MRTKGIRGTQIVLISERSFDSGEIRDFIRKQRQRKAFGEELLLYRNRLPNGRCIYHAAEIFDRTNQRHAALELEDVTNPDDEKWMKRCYENTLCSID